MNDPTWFSQIEREQAEAQDYREQMGHEYMQAQYLAAGLPHHNQDHEHTMKIDKLLTSTYLKQSDIDGEAIVTIKELKKQNVAQKGEDAEYKYVLYFAEQEKGMVLNATNIKRLGKVCGDDTDDWIGQIVVLYVDENVEYGGNIVGGLRIRGSTRKAMASKPTDDDINRKLAAAATDDAPF